MDDGGGAARAPHRSAVAAVVAHLEHLIFEELEVGAALPAEAELARRVGVSRLTVREAIRTLEARGLVRTSRGRRPQVIAPDGFAVGDFIRSLVRRDPRMLLELLDVRQALEVHIAALAAQRASRAAVAGLEAAVEAMRTAPPDPEAFSRTDVDFHEALGAACGNRLLALVLEELAEPLRVSMGRSYAGHVARGVPVETTVEQHAQIVAAVKAHDPRAAATAMRLHLEQTERDLLAGIHALAGGAPASA